MKHAKLWAALVAFILGVLGYYNPEVADAVRDGLETVVGKGERHGQETKQETKQEVPPSQSEQENLQEAGVP